MAVIGGVFLLFLIAVIKYTGQLQRERIYLTHNSKLQSILAGKSRRQELEATIHVAARKQRFMNNCAQLIIFYFIQSGSQYREWCHSQ